MENSYTNTVLKAIGKALNEGVNDIRVVTITIAAAVIITIVLAAATRIRNTKRKKSATEASYQKLIRKFNLTILEMDLVDKLSGSLLHPEDKYLLLINKSRYRQAVHNTVLADGKEKELAEQLKIKLGHLSSDSDTDEISTKSLSQGQPVKLEIKQGEYCSAEIYSISESNLTVKCPGQTTPVTADEEINLFVCASDGFKLFKLVVDKVRNELFSAPHADAEKIDKLNTGLDINIEIEKPDKFTEIKSSVVRLSARGALVTDKKTDLSEGDKIRLMLSNDIKRANRLNAEVIKISADKGLASVKFTDLNS